MARKSSTKRFTASITFAAGFLTAVGISLLCPSGTCIKTKGFSSTPDFLLNLYLLITDDFTVRAFFRRCTKVQNKNKKIYDTIIRDETDPDFQSIRIRIRILTFFIRIRIRIRILNTGSADPDPGN